MGTIVCVDFDELSKTCPFRYISACEHTRNSQFRQECKPEKCALVVNVDESNEALRKSICDAIESAHVDLTNEVNRLHRKLSSLTDVTKHT